MHVLRVDEPSQLSAWVAALEDLSRANSKKRKDSLIRETRSSNLALQASRCANCKESFGITGKKLLCASCGFVFCSSLQCSEAKSLHGHSGGRCCVNCANARDAASPSAASPSASGVVSPLSRLGSMRSLLNGGGGSTRLLSSSASAPFSPKHKPSNANLLIRVMAGRHLMVCDANGFSDPYVVIFFDQQEYRTEIQFQTLNPVWNQLFSIPVTGHSRDIQIGVYDSDRYSNDDFMVGHQNTATVDKDARTDLLACLRRAGGRLQLDRRSAPRLISLRFVRVS